MIALLQRVTSASVEVDDRRVASIDAGLLVLLGVEPDDTEASAEVLLSRLIRYRIFSDTVGRMNLSLLDTSGDLLLVPQFTLAADTKKGLRPGFSTAASPAEGERLFDIMVRHARQLPLRVGVGEFGADMKVALINDGPATFWLQEPSRRRAS
ncbi:D-tyrosyl-tRNA(Tyr) deacylase [Chromatiales bacterium (ex Bugula neritina AB1)]|nr:D-tyrosyl-tRNA(Tyr) deacylase [Chromatiales bacterium (ex Bugula neritina AB1)]